VYHIKWIFILYLSFFSDESLFPPEEHDCRFIFSRLADAVLQSGFRVRLRTMKKQSQYWHNCNQKCCVKQSRPDTERSRSEPVSISSWKHHFYVNPLIQHLCCALSCAGGWERGKASDGCGRVHGSESCPAVVRTTFEWLEPTKVRIQTVLFLSRCGSQGRWSLCVSFNKFRQFFFFLPLIFNN